MSQMTSQVASKSVDKVLASRSVTTYPPFHWKVVVAPTQLHQQQMNRWLSSSTTTPTPTKKESKSFMEWYEGHLEATPIRTKMVTGCILWSAGDAVAQLVPHMSNGTMNQLAYDWPRTGRAALFGFALHAPTSHVHYNFLEWMTVRAGFTGISVPIFKAFMEQVRV